jgi:DNA adenine methylase
MKNCRHNWLITYNDSTYVRNLFSFAEITARELIYGMRNVSDNSDAEILVVLFTVIFGRSR